MRIFSPYLLPTAVALVSGLLQATDAKAECGPTQVWSAPYGAPAPFVYCEPWQTAPVCSWSNAPPTRILGTRPSPAATYGYDIDGAPIISMGPLEMKTQEYTVTRDPDEDFELVPMIREILVNKLDLSEQEAAALINNYQESQGP